MNESRYQAAAAALLSSAADLAQLAKVDPIPAWVRADFSLIADARQLAAGGTLPDTALSTRLLSPFCGIKGYPGEVYLPLKALNPLDKTAIFPHSKASQIALSDLQALWRGLEQDWQAAGIDPSNNPAVIELLLTLLQRYAWCVPSRAQGVSAYDLGRTGAAVAACLSDNPVGETLAILVSGDFSGLQKFLYTLASDGAAKALRARSVYLQWLAYAVVYALLAELDLPLTSLLYVGGGTFQLLVPAGCKADLPDLAASFNRRLLTLHNGELGLTLAGEELNRSDFADFSAVRERLGRRLNSAKRRPFSAMGEADLLKAIGEPISQGGDPLTFCRVTGEDGVTVEQRQEDWKSRFIWDLEALGARLPYAAHLLFQIGDPIPASRAVGWQQALQTFGFYAYLLTDQVETASLPAEQALWHIWRLKPGLQARHEPWAAMLPGTCLVSYQMFAQLSARHLQEPRPKTFDELAQPLAGGLERWGVLRMDIDDLGNIFKEGYGGGASLARSAGLSFALRLFFEGWLPQLADPQQDIPGAAQDLSAHLNLQYSGGDDLFVVGAWDALPEFARRIRLSLEAFASGNPHLTISAGIELFPARYPLYQAARLAEAAEKASKDFLRPDGRGKDAITFLGQTLDWKEFEEVQRLAAQMADLVRANALSSGALQVILQLNAKIHQDQRRRYRQWLNSPANRGRQYKPKRFIYGPWTWLAAYQFTRMARNLDTRRDLHRQAADLLEKIQSTYLTPHAAASLETNALAARWAQFLVRGG